MTRDLLPELPDGAFAKQDGGDDLAFYAPARLVTHIDEGAVAALTARYRTLLPEDSCVLDLMSSWVMPAPRRWRSFVSSGSGNLMRHGQFLFWRSGKQTNEVVFTLIKAHSGVVVVNISSCDQP